MNHSEPRRCHRCSSLCDAYTHESISDPPLYFCIYYCAKYHHDSTGDGIKRTATQEIVIPAGKPLYLRDETQTKFFFSEEEMQPMTREEFYRLYYGDNNGRT